MALTAIALQIIIGICSTWASASVMRWAPHKYTILARRRLKLLLAGETVPQVEIAISLGLDFSHSSMKNTPTSSRIRNARRRVHELKEVGLLGRLHPHGALKILTTFVLLLYEYGLAMTPVTQAQTEATDVVMREALAFSIKVKRTKTVRRPRPIRH